MSFFKKLFNQDEERILNELLESCNIPYSLQELRERGLEPAQIVFATKNYDAISNFESNRDKDSKYVNKIIESIHKVGPLMIPVIVNHDFKIIDGQHRFEAFKATDNEVYAIINPDYQETHMIAANEASHIWKNKDYLYHHVFNNNKGIRLLERWMTEYKFNSPETLLKTIIATTLKLDKNRVMEEFRTGKLEITDDQAEQIEYFLLEFTEIFSELLTDAKVSKTLKSASFLDAFYLYYNFKGFNKEFFKINIQNKKNPFYELFDPNKSKTISYALECIQIGYNWKMKNKKNIISCDTKTRKLFI